MTHARVTGRYADRIRIGITGQHGFLGSALAAQVSVLSTQFLLVPFERGLFESEVGLAEWVKRCDCIVHLAATNRHPSPMVAQEMNVALCERLAAAVERAGTRPHVIFSSSIQETLPNAYGQSKREGRELLRRAAAEQGAAFAGFVIPNIFGPFGRPHYNSVVATFCDQLCRGEVPKIERDTQLRLIYVGEVVNAILEASRERRDAPHCPLDPTAELSVSEVLAQLRGYADGYLAHGSIPTLPSSFDVNLFNTFRSYIDHASHFPRFLTPQVDGRGVFVEMVRSAAGGQSSFSTTAPGITRGNHFHTRKVERFIVISGRAVIRLRKYRSAEVLTFELDGGQPSYVDMPIWYTHNIQNVGESPLLTVFWINEPFDPRASDTFAEPV